MKTFTLCLLALTSTVFAEGDLLPQDAFDREVMLAEPIEMEVAIADAPEAEEPCPPPVNPCCNRWLAELKFSAFRPKSNVLRDIYSDYWFQPQFDLSVRTWNDFYIWTGVSYLWEEGTSVNGDDPTWIRIVPLTLGAKYIYCASEYFDIYAGLGMRYFFLEVKNNSNAVKERVNESGLGGAVTAGGYYKYNRYRVNLFFDYAWKQLSSSNNLNNVKTTPLDVGGLSFGAGFGILF